MAVCYVVRFSADCLTGPVLSGTRPGRRSQDGRGRDRETFRQPVAVSPAWGWDAVAMTSIPHIHPGALFEAARILRLPAPVGPHFTATR